MDTKTAEFFSMLEDDEDDVIFFTFPNQKKKVKCSIGMLTESSPVFGAMFSSRWNQEQTEGGNVQADSIDPASKDNTIHLSDDVNFDQYSAFKLLIQILYGLRQMDSLTVEQATNIFYYAHKYEIKDAEEKIQKFLNERMESGISNLPLSVAELTEGIEFAQLYRLDEFKNKLDRVKLAFDGEYLNAMQFWDLATKFEMKTLQQQIIDRLVNVAPKKDWPIDLLFAVTQHLQKRMGTAKKALTEVICACEEPVEPYILHCSECGEGYSSVELASVFQT